MHEFPRHLPALRLVATAAALSVALAAGCSKKTEELPTPAVAVMPSDAPPSNVREPVDVPVIAAPLVGSASAVTIVLPPPIANVQGGGTVSVISGTRPATAPSTDTTFVIPAAPLTVGLPPAPSASPPGETTIEPGASPPSDQPPSVSPGSTK